MNRLAAPHGGTRTRRNTLLLASFALAFGAARLDAQQPTSEAAPFAIKGVQAKLYYKESASFSDDMLAVPQLSLWNTPIGGGWAKYSSGATLVLVEVAGPVSVDPRPRGVELTVSEDSPKHKRLMRRRLDVDAMERGAKQYLGFWLYDTGCVPLVLDVRLVGQADSATIQKKIPFECGE